MVLNCIKLIFNWFLDLIFPIFCVVCDKYGDFLCADCFEKLNVKPKFISSRSLVKKKRVSQSFSRYIAAVWWFWDYRDERIKKIIQEYKFSQIKGLAPYFAKIFRRFFQDLKNIEIVPVAPNKNRMKARGFDHIHEILPQNRCSVFVRLERIKNTAIQSLAQDKKERLKNLKNAFVAKVSPGADKSKIIYLVDDILSSGATALSVAKTLRQVGYKKIYLIVLAYRKI